MPADAPGREPRISVSDQDPISYERAKRLLLAKLPSSKGVDLDPAARDRLADTQVEVLVQIGGYIVDRWAAETQAQAELGTDAKPSMRQAARRRAIDACTGLHFTTITERAHASLRAYQDRHREVMPATVVRNELARATAQLHAYEDIRRWQWWLVEAFKGFWGFIGLTVIGGGLVLIATRVFPELPHAIVEGVRQLLEPSSGR